MEVIEKKSAACPIVLDLTMLLFLRDISIVCLNTAQEKLISVQNEVSEGMSLVDWPETISIVG